jgi:hypothetical protein
MVSPSIVYEVSFHIDYNLIPSPWRSGLKYYRAGRVRN